MKIKLNKKFIKKLKVKFANYNIFVGVLEDFARKKAAPAKINNINNLRELWGGLARKTKRTISKATNLDISEKFRKKHDYLRKPFRQKSDDIIQFSNNFMKYCVGKCQQRRLENLLQAIVRNPILKGDYGTNSPQTVKIKGFNRYMIDTGQFFKSIKAKIEPKNKYV